MSGILLIVSVKATVLLGLAFGGARIMARAPAASRSALWAATAGALSLLPILEAALPGWRVPVLPAAALVTASYEEGVEASGRTSPPPKMHSEPAVGDAARSGSVGTAGRSFAGRGRPGGTAVARSGEGGRSRMAAWSDLALLLWLAGFGWMLARLLVQRRRLSALLDRGIVDTDGAVARVVRQRARAMGIARPPRVVLSAEDVVPVTWGVLRPVVVLPRTALDWPDAQIRTAVIHELAHVKRGDVATATIGALACAVHWFNPLAWIALRRLRAEQELACDDLVLRHGAAPADYAAALVAIARVLRSPASVSPLAASVVRPGSLNDRVRAILDVGRRREGLPPARCAALVGSVLVGTGVLAAFAPAAVRARVPASPSERDIWITEPSAVAAQLPPCWREDGPRSLSVNVDSRVSRLRVERSDDECEGRILLSGPVSFDLEFTRTLAGGTAGDSLVLEERTAEAWHRVRVTSSRRGVVAVDHWRNGERSGRATARAFLDSRATTLAHYTWAVVASYVETLLAAGGPDAVIEAIDAMPPDRVAARYVDELLGRASLTDDQMRRLLRVIRRGITSDGTAADVLHLVAVRDREVAAHRRSEMLAAMASVGSDGTHAEMLSRMITATPSVDIAAMTLQSAVATIGSDGVMADFILRTLDRVPQLVAHGSNREALDRAVATIGSDRLRARVASRLAGLP